MDIIARQFRSKLRVIGWLAPLLFAGIVWAKSDSVPFLSKSPGPPSNQYDVVKAGLGQRYVVNGQPQKNYDKVERLSFAPGGNSFAYSAQQGSLWFTVANGTEGKPYDYVLGPNWSASGDRLAYAALREGRMFYVVEGKEQKGYARVADFYFGKDGGNFIYRATQDRQWFVVWNGQESPRYDEVWLYGFSADGGSYAARSQGKEFVVWRGEKQAEFDLVGQPVVSSNGRQVAYAAERDGKQYIVLNGKEFGPHDGAGEPVFSPDGRRFAYLIGSESGARHVVLDGNELKQHDVFYPPTFSPDSQSYAFIARPPSSKDAGSDYVVRDGKPHQRRYLIERQLYWSPDSKTLAYQIRDKPGNERMVVNEEAGRSFESLDPPQFSENQQWVGYWARKKGHKNWVDKIWIQQKIQPLSRTAP